MIIKEKEMRELVEDVLSTENTFLCERQFQFELAWKLREYFKEEKKNEDVKIILEYPSREVVEDKDKKAYYDIVLIEGNNKCIIELKYKTGKIMVKKEGETKRTEKEIECYGEKFFLKDQSVHDLARYDFWHDLARIKNYTEENKNSSGFAIFVTNDDTYLVETDKNCLSAEFSLVSKEDKCGKLNWNPAHTESCAKYRREEIDLKNSSYKLIWKEIGKQDKIIDKNRYSPKDNSKFRYLLLEIK